MSARGSVAGGAITSPLPCPLGAFHLPQHIPSPHSHQPIAEQQDAVLQGQDAGTIVQSKPCPVCSLSPQPPVPPQPIDYEGFRLFMKTYLEVEVPEELCQHLFTSFKRKSCQAAPEAQRQSPSISQLGEPAWHEAGHCSLALSPSALPALGRTELHGAERVFQSPSRLMPASPSRPRWPALLSQVPCGAVDAASAASPHCWVCSVRSHLLREHIKLQKQ